MVMYEYHESDDASASTYCLTINDVMEWIKDHNEYFGTEYNSIEEFNKGEPYSSFSQSIISVIN